MTLTGSVEKFPPTRRRSILMVSQDDLYPRLTGGMEIRGRELSDHFRQTCDVSVLSGSGLTTRDGSYQPLTVPEWECLEGRPNRIRCARDRLGWARRNIAFTVAERRRVKKFLYQVRPDLIYLNKFGYLHPAILHDLTNTGVPIIAWFGDRYGKRLRSYASGSWRRRLILGITSPPRNMRHTTLVFNCRFLQQFYAAIFAGYSSQCVIYDGVDTELFQPAAAYPPSPRFVFLGRATREKGFIEFCRVMSLLPLELIGSIDIIGDGPCLSEGLELLRASGRAERVQHIGAVPRNAVPDLLRRSTICVHPSHDEGMPASIMEAMACGLAVVTTNVGGISEVVGQGQSGLLASLDDFTGLVHACRTVAEHVDLRAALGRRARHCMVSRFDRRGSLEETRKLVASVIEGKIPRAETDS